MLINVHSHQTLHPRAHNLQCYLLRRLVDDSVKFMFMKVLIDQFVLPVRIESLAVSAVGVLANPLLREIGHLPYLVIFQHRDALLHEILHD